MTLSARQQQTIENLKRNDRAVTPQEIITYCEEQMTRPVYNKGLKRPVRHHGKQYFKDIIKFYRGI